jgi:hypothetical protein
VPGPVQDVEEEAIMDRPLTPGTDDHLPLDRRGWRFPGDGHDDGVLRGNQGGDGVTGGAKASVSRRVHGTHGAGGRERRQGEEERGIRPRVRQGLTARTQSQIGEER